MPHDKNGVALKVGDTVNVPCTVTAVHEADGHCNVTLDTVEPMYPGQYKTAISVNGRQVIKVEPEAAKTE